MTAITFGERIATIGGLAIGLFAISSLATRGTYSDEPLANTYSVVSAPAPIVRSPAILVSFAVLAGGAFLGLHRPNRRLRLGPTLPEGPLSFPAAGRSSRGDLCLAEPLRRAIAEDQLEVYFQPLVAPCDGRVMGAEALLRWTSPELGSVPPDRFVPVAEDTGSIVEIGAWVLQVACREASRWSAETGDPLRLAVNVSPRQLLDGDLFEAVAAALGSSGLPPDRLILEITERLLVDDDERIDRVVRRLDKMGVRLALDDFGTGYSALAYLRRLPLHLLKIDRSFVANLLTHRQDRAVASAIIAMGRSLGLEIVAEGVETPWQLEFLRDEGCDLAQGFLFSKAVPSAAIPQLCRAGFGTQPVGRWPRHLHAVS